MDTNTKKNISKKSSLLMCFKPVLAKNKSLKSKTRKDQTTTYVRVDYERGGGVVLPELSSGLDVAADNGGGVGRRGNSKDIWLSLRAALNQTSLNKTNNKRKTGKEDLSRSNISNQKQYEVEGKISKSRDKSTLRTNSSISSSSSYGNSSAFTASPSLTSSSSSRSDQSSVSLDSSNENGTKVTNQNQCGDQNNKRLKTYISMCMFFISLLVLIMWGKFFATLYTTIWFYAMPPRPTRPCNERDLSEDQRCST